MCSIFMHECNGLRLVLNKDEIQTCVDKLYLQTSTVINETQYDKTKFEVILLEIECISFLESFFIKDIVSIIIDYNGYTFDFEITISLYSTEHWYWLSHFGHRHLFYRIYNNGREEIENFMRYNKPNKSDMRCLTYIINNGMFESFVNMDPIQLFTACVEISRDKFNIEHYPKFYNFMHEISLLKKSWFELESAIVANVVYNMIKNKYEKK